MTVPVLGPLTLPADPTAALEAATRQYVDSNSGAGSGAGTLFGFNFDSGTAAGPGTSELRLNNATPASVNTIYVHYTSLEGVDIARRLLAGTTGDRLYMQLRTDSDIYRIYDLIGAPTDNTTYASIPVVHRASGGSLADADQIIAGFIPLPVTVATTAPASPLINDLWVDLT